MDKLRFMRNLQRFKVLILDDFGISKISTSESQDLFNIIDDRYKTASTVISTQVGGQAVLGRQSKPATPWLTERHGYDPTYRNRA